MTQKVVLAKAEKLHAKGSSNTEKVRRANAPKKHTHAKAVPARLGGEEERADFAPTLLRWGRVHGRKGLPWQVSDAYAVWVSEVMLQQTQVETVLKYYSKFMTTFPTVADLARAPEDEVLAVWAGLGYYRRAKFLHKAAKEVVANHGGSMPQKASELAELAGIGRSTAAAIASIAHGERVAIMDGNVVRVIARRWGMAADVSTGKALAVLWATAEELVDVEEPGLYTQSIMDLGATVCLPRAPLCLQCPFASKCVAFISGCPTAFPVKAKKQKERRVDVEAWRVWFDGRRVAMRKNTDQSGVWQSMLVFGRNDSALIRVKSHVDQSWAFKHVFSHYDLQVEVEIHRVETDELDMWAEREEWMLIEPAKALVLAVPKPVKDVLARLMTEKKSTHPSEN